MDLVILLKNITSLQQSKNIAHKMQKQKEQPTGPKLAKKTSKIDDIDLSLLLTLESKEQLKKFLNEQIKPIPFKLKEQLYQKMYQVARGRYCLADANKINPQRVHELFVNLERVNEAVKESQITSPIVDIINKILIDLLQLAKAEGIVDEQQLISLWQCFPPRFLEQFLVILNLEECYRALDEHKFTKDMIELINDNKINQCCHYYKLYRPLPEFEETILLPKIANTGQIYTDYIVALLKQRPNLKLKVINEVDPAKAVILLEQMGEDPRQCDQVHRFVLRKHYGSATHEYKQWYIFEDKMCFSSQFIQWYCQEHDLSPEIKQSIRFRNQIGGHEQKVPNPVYLNDAFKAAEVSIPELLHIEANKSNLEYLTLKDYGIEEQDVHWIDSTDSQAFECMVEVLSRCSEVGFDAEYRCSSTKYEQLGVAIIQLSTGKQVYIIDFVKLESDAQFVQFFGQLLSNPDLVVVGHSVASDFRYIEKTMKINAVEGVMDIAKLFKQKFPNEAQSSLAFITEFLLGKRLSKYEQRSNWNRRPLKKTQLHYAALDAQVCLAIFDVLRGQEVKLTEVKYRKQKVDMMIRSDNFVYQPSHQHLIDDKRPKFLIDSMLKKLCSLLRNLGIDTEYMGVSNFELMEELAVRENRIILTRDKKLLAKKLLKMPLYCIEEKGDSDLMLEEVKKFFKLDLKLFKPLSRCVKCNCPDLQSIAKDEAMKFVNFEHEDSNIEEFWRCCKCNQIYWQGNQFKNASKKFNDLK